MATISGLTPGGLYIFHPEQSGLVNRDFSEVTADGNVYRYQTQTFNGQLGNTEVVLLGALEQADLRQCT